LVQVDDVLYVLLPDAQYDDGTNDEKKVASKSKPKKRSDSDDEDDGEGDNDGSGAEDEEEDTPEAKKAAAERVAKIQADLDETENDDGDDEDTKQASTLSASLLLTNGIPPLTQLSHFPGGASTFESIVIHDAGGPLPTVDEKSIVTVWAAAEKMGDETLEDECCAWIMDHIMPPLVDSIPNVHNVDATVYGRQLAMIHKIISTIVADATMLELHQHDSGLLPALNGILAAHIIAQFSESDIDDGKMVNNIMDVFTPLPDHVIAGFLAKCLDIPVSVCAYPASLSFWLSL
jgi:hypothetical protein